MKRIPHYDVYEVNSGEKNVLLNIKIGFGQQAITKIYLDNVLKKTVKNSITNLAIGKNCDLQFSKMEFNTVITNTQPNSNAMSYQFGLKGGVKTLNIPTDSCTATHPGELFIIDTRIDFL